MLGKICNQAANPSTTIFSRARVRFRCQMAARASALSCARRRPPALAQGRLQRQRHQQHVARGGGVGGQERVHFRRQHYPPLQPGRLLGPGGLATHWDSLVSSYKNKIYNRKYDMVLVTVLREADWEVL